MGSLIPSPCDTSYPSTLQATKLSVEAESFPIRGHFSFAHTSITETRVVTVTLISGNAKGHGECVPMERYGETVEDVVSVIEGVKLLIEKKPDRVYLGTVLPPGAARSAIDCALWDLEAKCTGVRVFERAGLALPKPVTTAFTISLDTPAAMAAIAAREAARPLLKIKLCGQGDQEILRAVRAAAPSAMLIAAPNGSWAVEDLPSLIAACVEVDVKLIQDPLPIGADAALRTIKHLIPICARDSVQGVQGLAELRDRYDAVAITIDSAGGLSEALQTVALARKLGFSIMISSAPGSSLGHAPGLLLAKDAEFADLDGPLLLEYDRPEGLVYQGSTIYPSTPQLWG